MVLCLEMTYAPARYKRSRCRRHVLMLLLAPTAEELEAIETVRLLESRLPEEL